MDNVREIDTGLGYILKKWVVVASNVVYRAVAIRPIARIFELLVVSSRRRASLHCAASLTEFPPSHSQQYIITKRKTNEEEPKTSEKTKKEIQINFPIHHIFQLIISYRFQFSKFELRHREYFQLVSTGALNFLCCF